jgi:hypothetical protein
MFDAVHDTTRRHGRHDLPHEAHPRQRRVPALGGKLGRVHHPRSVGVQHRHVGGPRTRAGPEVSRSMAVSSGRSPRWTRAITSPKAVSRPLMPNAASAHAQVLSTVVWGAWSVATASMTPSRSPATSAWASARVRSGGLTLARVS